MEKSPRDSAPMEPEVWEQAAAIERSFAAAEERIKALHRRYLSLLAGMILFGLVFTYVIMNDITWRVARDLECEQGVTRE